MGIWVCGYMGTGLSTGLVMAFDLYGCGMDSYGCGMAVSNFAYVSYIHIPMPIPLSIFIYI